MTCKAQENVLADLMVSSAVAVDMYIVGICFFLCFLPSFSFFVHILSLYTQSRIALYVELFMLSLSSH